MFTAKCAIIPQARARLNRLVRGLIDDGLLKIEYNANQTYHRGRDFPAPAGELFIVLTAVYGDGA